MLHKSFEPLDTKVDAEAGTFEATVAVFNNVDKGGDRILPGAFAKTLAAWKASGDPIPVIFNHDWGTPDAHVGVVTDAVETTKGLFVKGTLDVADNPVAKQVHRLMERRSLKEFSFGYSVPKGGEKRAKDGANDLLEIDLAEVGPTLKGMNPATELHAVKSALGVESVPDAADQRAKAEALAREVEEAQIPSLPAEVKRLASDIREALDSAGAERFGRTETKWVYVDDYDPDAKWAVYVISSTDGTRYVQVAYALNGDGSLSLDTAETEVVRTTSYRAADGSKTFTTSELQEVKGQLAQVREELDALKKANVTDKAPKARSVDSLRQQAETTALEVASGGIRLPKPPKSAAPPREPSIPLKELRQRMRDEMLGVLSGEPTT